MRTHPKENYIRATDIPSKKTTQPGYFQPAVKNSGRGNTFYEPYANLLGKHPELNVENRLNTINPREALMGMATSAGQKAALGYALNIAWLF